MSGFSIKCVNLNDLLNFLRPIKYSKLQDNASRRPGIKIHFIYILIILLIGISSKASSIIDQIKEIALKTNCQDDKIRGNILRINADRIREKMHYESVKSDVDLLMKTIRLCGKEPDQTFYRTNLLNFWVKTGYKSGLKNLKEKIIIKSRYSNPKKEFEKFRELYKEAYPRSKQREILNLKKIIDRNLKKVKDNCSNINNTTGSLGELKDQDNLGWCTAYTLSDLIDHKTGLKSSAFSIALNYLEKKLKNFDNIEKDFTKIEGAPLEDSLKKTLKYGVCLEEDLPSENIRDLISDLETIKETGEFFYFKNVETTFSSLPYQELINIIINSPDSSYLTKLYKKSCKRQDLSHIDYSTKFSRNKVLILNRINTILERGSIIGISYNLKPILNHDSILKMGKKKSIFHHASTIIGRQYNEEKNSCDYIIRGTYGTSCSMYNGLEVSCKEGYIFIDREKLESLITGSIYLKNK